MTMSDPLPSSDDVERIRSAGQNKAAVDPELIARLLKESTEDTPKGKAAAVYLSAIRNTQARREELDVALRVHALFLRRAEERKPE